MTDDEMLLLFDFAYQRESCELRELIGAQVRYEYIFDKVEDLNCFSATLPIDRLSVDNLGKGVITFAQECALVPLRLISRQVGVAEKQTLEFIQKTKSKTRKPYTFQIYQAIRPTISIVDNGNGPVRVLAAQGQFKLRIDEAAVRSVVVQVASQGPSGALQGAGFDPAAVTAFAAR